MKRILVTGSARSGTAYVASYFRLFTGCPYDVVGHEDVYGLHRRTNRGVEIVSSKLDWPTVAYTSWGLHQIEVSWLAAPFLESIANDAQFLSPIIIHLVRDPIASIASIYRRGFLATGNAYGEFANTHLGGDSEFFDNNLLERACHYWCHWNLAILTSKRAMAVWRLERLASSDIASVLNAAQIPYTPTLPPPKGVNRGDREGMFDPDKVPKCLADIPSRYQGLVQETGATFGYEVK